MLTHAAVKKLKPHQKRREVPDAHGLLLVIQPSGHKSWALRFRRPDGRTAKLTLGTCDVYGAELEGEPAIGGHLTLAAARRLAAEVNRQRAIGKDVIAERRAERQHRISACIDAERAKFPSGVRDYIEREARGRKKNRGWRNTAALLGLAYSDDANEPTLIPGGLAERWLERDVSSITSDEVFILTEEARERGVPGREARSCSPSEARARELACALSVLFRWLRAKRRIAIDPCAGMARPGGSNKRERVLNVKANVRRADELRWLWAATNSVGGPFGALVKFLILTGQRRREVAEMERRELADDLWSWTIPSARTKNKREHVIPLSGAAAEVVKTVLEDPSNKSPFVFSTNGKTPLSGFSKFKRRLDRAMLQAASNDDPQAVIRPWTLHDLRRTAVTGMIEIGVEPHVVEAVVNHISGHKGGVAGVYNVAAYAEPKRKALERWAAQIKAIVSDEERGKVLPMRGRS